jgi:hypothetical protein
MAIHEFDTLNISVRDRLPSPPAQQCIHDPETDVSGLLEVRAGV